MDKLSNIQNLIFDFGVVLIDLDKERCVENFKALGFENPEEMIQLTHNQGVAKAFETGELTAAQFRDELRGMTSQTLTDEQIDQAWISLLGDVPQYKLDMLLELKQRFRVFMLSNTNPIHFEYARKHIFEKNGHTLKDYFENCFLSYEIGLAKPDDDIFEHVINEAQIFARKSLFIDDSEKNLEGAMRWCFEVYKAKANEDFSHLFK